MIYDFKKGQTATYLLNKLRAQFAKGSSFEFEHFEAVHHETVKVSGNSFLLRTGESEHYMFAYKKRFSTESFGTLPKYHITDCETRETYTGFWFANRMPVNIYCLDQRKSLGAQNLELCKNCHRELSFFSYGDDTTDWFDVILKLAENREYGEGDLRFDGYTRDWVQVSKALRYKRGFVCESCGINLSERNAEYFCEVHHIDGDKSNNSLDNLKCLCVRCHINVDETHKRLLQKKEVTQKLKQFEIYFDN